MTWLTVAQLLLAAVVIAIVYERTRLLLYRAPLDTRRWLKAVRTAVADDDRPAAEATIAASRPAWIAETAHLALSDAPEAPGELDELLTDYAYEAFKRLRALRILASAGTASGFFGAVLELIWMLEGEHGLAGLKAGRVEGEAARDALLAIALGIVISVVAFVALNVLKRAAVQLVTDVRKVAADLSH